MRYFLQEFSEKERFEKNFCLYCGICTDIEDMDILRELHFECWKWYRQKGIPYKVPKYYRWYFKTLHIVFEVYSIKLINIKNMINKDENVYHQLSTLYDNWKIDKPFCYSKTETSFLQNYIITRIGFWISDIMKQFSLFFRSWAWKNYVDIY